MSTISKLNEDSSIKIPEYILEKSGLKPWPDIINGEAKGLCKGYEGIRQRSME